MLATWEERISEGLTGLRMRTGQRMAMAFDFLILMPKRYSPSSRNRNGRRKQWQQQRRSGDSPPTSRQGRDS
ncbi:hypothetical protein SLE2022_262510 [Rubroshorea leprosula]